MGAFSVACRGDRRFAFDPERTAVLAIDMQREFFTDDIGAAVGEMRAMIPRATRLLALARQIGCRVIHTRESYSADMSDVSAYRRSLDYVGRPAPLGPFLLRGQSGHEFVPDVAPAAGETVIDKPGFSAFYASPLDGILRDAGITHLLFAGVTTQCCVHSTLRDAVDRGYWCLTVEDCCAASEPDMHAITLRIIASEGHLFGWIADVDAVAAAVDGGAA